MCSSSVCMTCVSRWRMTVWIWHEIACHVGSEGVLRVDKMPSKCLLFGRHRGRIYIWDTVQILQTMTTVLGLLHTGKGDSSR